VEFDARELLRSSPFGAPPMRSFFGPPSFRKASMLPRVCRSIFPQIPQEYTGTLISSRRSQAHRSRQKSS
jgi:hypothetical protein